MTALPTVLGPPADESGQIARLSELHAAGILTDDEFSAEKADLLDRLVASTAGYEPPEL